MANLGLGIEITANDLASGTLSGVGKNSNQLKGNLGNLGRAATQVFAGIVTSVSAVKAAMSFTQPFADFENGLTAVSEIAIGGKESFEGLRDAALDAGINTRFSPKEAVDGLLDLSTAGQTAKQAITTLNPVLDLASASLGQLGVSDSATAVVGTLNSFGLAANKAGEVSDKLTRITQLSNFQMRDFGAGLAKAAAAGGMFEQDMSSTLITLGLMRNRNIDASSAATAYRESLRRLGSDQRAQKAVTELGIDVFDKSTGKMRDMNNIMLDFSAATKDLTTKERNAAVVRAFGARGMLAFGAVADATFTTMKDGNEITLEGREAVAGMAFELEASKGAAKKFAKVMQGTFSGLKVQLAGTVETLQTVAGEGLGMFFKPIIADVTDSLNQLASFVRSMSPEMKANLGKMMAGFLGFVVVGGILMAVAGALTLLGSAAMPLIGILGAATLLASGFGTSMAQNGGTASRTFATLKAVATDAWAGIQALWTGIKAFFAGFASGFGEGIAIVQPTIDAFMGVVEQLRMAFSGAAGSGSTFAAVGKAIGKAFAFGFGIIVRVLTIAGAIVAGFSSSVGGITTVLDPLFNALAKVGGEVIALVGSMGLLTSEGEGVTTVFGTIGAFIGNVFQAIVHQVANAVNIIGTVLKGMVTIFGGIFDIIDGLVTGNWAKVWMGAKKVFFGFVQVVVGMFAGMVQAIAGMIDQAAMLVGKKSNLAGGVSDIKSSMLKGIQGGLGIEEPVAAANGAPTAAEQAATGNKALDDVLAATASASAGIPGVPTAAAQIDVAAQTAGMKEAAVAAAVAAAKAQPVPVTQATLNVDGQFLAELVATHEADGANGAGVNVDVNGS